MTTNIEAAEALSQRTGVAPEAIEKLPTASIQSHFNKSVNPSLWVMETMASSPFLLSAMYTAGTGRFITAAIMGAIGGYLLFDAKGRYETNQNVTRDVTRELALKIA